MSPRLAAALRYAQAGWPVFPCVPGEKAPVTKHGFLDATTDPDKITWWWSRNPDRNVAIATGAPGPDVLDVDVHKGGTGFAAFNRLHHEGLLGGASAYIRTPSGGMHAYFAGSEQGNGRLPRHHLDFRSKGGYVVAPPSAVNGRRYELIKLADGRDELDWAAVSRLLEPEPQQRPQQSDERSTDGHWLAEWMARQQEGNRNDGLFWAANRALEAGLTDLGELAEAARRTGLEEREIARTIASARRLSAAEPLAPRKPVLASPRPEPQAPAHGTPDRAEPSSAGRPAGPAPIREWNRRALEHAAIVPADEDKEAEAR